MDIEMWSGVDSYWWMPRPARVRVPCDSPRHRCQTWLCPWCVAGDVGSSQTLDHRHCTASLYGSEGHAAESPGGPCSCWGACRSNAAPARCICEWHHCRCYWQISHHSQHHHGHHSKLLAKFSCEWVFHILLKKKIFSILHISQEYFNMF